VWFRARERAVHEYSKLRAHDRELANLLYRVLSCTGAAALRHCLLRIARYAACSRGIVFNVAAHG